MQLIGIYIDDATSSIRKSLKENWYPFYSIAEIDNSLFKSYDENTIAAKLKTSIKKNKEFTNQLYKLDNNPKLTINLDCIVGKNGSGKSTLLDIVYRVFNNFGVKIKQIKPELNQDYRPLWAAGVKSRLYFESNDLICCIKTNGDINNFYDYEEDDIPIDFYCDGNKKIFTKENLQSDFFDYIPYTIATNYSFYSGKDDYDSDTEWINRLYNKNDGYITPIVFAPYKNNNKIDIENENNIGKERVMYLSLLIQSINQNNDFLENYKLLKIKYRLKTTDYYKENFEESNFSNYEDELLNKLYEKYHDEIFVPNSYESSKLEENEQVSEEEYNKQREKDKLIKKMEFKIQPLLKFIKDKWKSYLCIQNENVLLRDYVLPYLSYKTIKICLQYETFKKKFTNRLIYEEYTNSELGELANLEDEKQKDFIEKINSTIKELSPFEKDDDIKTHRFILERRNHINLKIFQCLRFYYENENNSVLDNGCSYASTLIDQIRNKCPKSDTTQEKIITYDDVVENLYPSFLEKKIFYRLKITDLSDEEYDKDETKPKIQLTQMSSGEQQLYFSLSYAIYHIKNIESVKEGDNKIKYKNINLIFDEAELYYHPEYQRNYIKNLLTVLKNSNIDEALIKSINITIVTHSPYLISDIPASNILKLEQGAINQNNEKTFCANFYDLIKNQFFLSSIIGGIAEKYINEIIKVFEIKNKIQKNEILKNDEQETITDKEKEELNQYIENRNFYNQLINSIGDSYLSLTLKREHDFILEEQDLINRAKEKLLKMSKDELNKFLGEE